MGLLSKVLREKKWYITDVNWKKVIRRGDNSNEEKIKTKIIVSNEYE